MDTDRSKKKVLDIDEILPYIGEFGKFQKILVAMLTIIYFSMSFQILMIYFSTMIPSWQCNANSTVCHFNGTLSPDDHSRCNMTRTEWHYVEPNHYSLATQFDIKCDEHWKLELTSAIFFVGWGIGAILYGYLGDKFGRKILLFPSVTGIYVVCFASAFMPNITLVMICRLIIGVLIVGAIVQPSILMAELVGNKHRPISGLIPMLAYPSGYCVLALKAYLLRNWKLLSIVCTVPYVWVLAFYTFVPESVRWMQINGKADEVMIEFRRIARWNKMDLPNNIVLATPPSGQQKVSGSLLKSKKVILQTLIQGLVWMASAMCFYGLQLAANDLAGSVYKDFVYLSVIAVPAILLDIYVCDNYGRKKAILCPLFLAGVACLCVAFIPPTGTLRTVRVVFGILGKCMATAPLEGLYIWSAEVFTTDIRSKGMGFVQVRCFSYVLFKVSITIRFYSLFGIIGSRYSDDCLFFFRYFR